MTQTVQFNQAAGYIQTSGNIFITGATSTAFTGTFNSVNTIVGMHGLTINTTEFGSKKITKQAEDGEPLFTIDSEDDEVFCVSVCYSDEQQCQDIPADFDFEQESLLELAITFNPEPFRYLTNALSQGDLEVQFVYKINGLEYTMVISEFIKLVS